MAPRSKLRESPTKRRQNKVGGVIINSMELFFLLVCQEFIGRFTTTQSTGSISDQAKSLEIFSMLSI